MRSGPQTIQFGLAWQVTPAGTLSITKYVGVGKLRLLGTPIRLYDTPPSHCMPPADLGEHNREVLIELGYSEEEIAELSEKGVLG